MSKEFDVVSDSRIVAQEVEKFNSFELRNALSRLGEILEEKNQSVEVAVAGGAVAVLYFENRITTRDVDVIFPQNERQRKILKESIYQVGEELNFTKSLAADWMNNDGEGIGMKSDPETVIFSEGGLTMKVPPFEELLAIKLCTWRNKNDVSDAKAIMKDVASKYEDNVDGLFEQVYKLKQFGNHIKKSVLRDRFDMVYRSVVQQSPDADRDIDMDLAYSAVR